MYMLKLSWIRKFLVIKCPVYKGMLKPIIVNKLTMCQLLYLTNTYKPREILLIIVVDVTVL